MATKGLRVAYERFGSGADPNAPHNRQNFDTQDTQQPAAAAPAAGTGLTGNATVTPPAAADTVLTLTGGASATAHRSVPPGREAQQGLALAAAAAAAAGVGAAAGGETVKISRPRRTPKVPKYFYLEEEGMVEDGSADAPGRSRSRSTAGKGKSKVCVSLSCTWFAGVDCPA